MPKDMLDLTGLKCPLPVLRTRKALLAISAGERLVVRCTDPMAVIDIPHLLHQNGDRLESLMEDSGQYTFVIIKGAPR